jgi:glycosyltransferase involved in cell wall biosynthesis
VLWLRRGILDFKPCPPTRTPRTPLRLLSVARLVPKKGHDFQLKVYSALHKAGVAFDATLIGDGPLRSKIEAEIRDAGLSGKVRLLGARGEAEVAEAFSQADVLLHTGVVASNGDRDGLPNVIGEAMSHGVVVLATPVAGVGEAIENGWNGLLGTPGAVDCWVRLLQELARDDALYNRLRLAAFAWVQAHFDARRNARRLLERIDATLAIADGPRMDSPKDSPPSRKRRRRRKPQARAVADASDSQQKPNSGSREGESLGAP